MHNRPDRPVLDPHDRQARNAQQPSRILNHARGSSDAGLAADGGVDVVTSLLQQQA
jgi:hypothetical protein